MEIYKKYEEYKKISQATGWLLLIALSAGLIGWAMVLNMLIPDTERHWDFGALPDTPAESRYSTVEPAVDEPAPVQLELPPGLTQKDNEAEDR